MARSIIRAQSIRAMAAAPGDSDYGSKLAKYVPAEAVTALITLIAIFDPTDKTGLWATAGFCLVLAIGFKIAWAKKEGVLGDVKLWEYLLVAVAFTCWAIGTTAVGPGLLELSAEWSAAILIAGAFAVPAADQWMTKAPE